MISNSADVVMFLKEQHEQIRAAFQDVLSARGEDRQKLFYALRRLLAVHETAEEEIVHPAARRALPDGEEVVQSRLSEEREAKRVLTELESLNIDSAEFETKFRALSTSVIAHAEREESTEFERLGDKLAADRLERMRAAVALAERVAPTRPHAGVESATANMLLGPFASMVDRVRDAISGKA